jgi:hypothetical protein
LSKADISALMSEYKNSESKDRDLGMSILKKGANVSDIFSFNDSNAKANAQLYARYLTQFDAAIAAIEAKTPGAPIDYTVIATGIIGQADKKAAAPKPDGALLGRVNAELVAKHKIKVQENIFTSPAAYNALKPKLSEALRKEIEDKHPGLRK